MSTLKDYSIATFDQMPVLECDENCVRIQNGQEFKSNFTIIAAGATAYEWLEKTDLSLKDGFINVDKYCE